jgi:hypothetical protein
MDDNFSEVTVVEQDLLMTVDDFAKQEGVTTRTVYRWMELGRLETVERLGKKYVNASVPLKTAINDNDNVRHDAKSQNAGALQNVNIFEEYLKTLRENSRRAEKSCRRWQMTCFASIFLFIVSLLACTSLALLYHYGTENLTERLDDSAAELAEVESGRNDALARAEGLSEQIELQIKPFKEENVRLRNRLDEVLAKNDALRDKLDETFGRNITLLERFSDQALEDEVASAAR